MRQIRAAIKRAVRERDGGRCTFVGADGHRCSAKRLLEFDHIQPFARGGESSVGNLRLRCRAHNQHGADGVFGRAFMERKRDAARRNAAEHAKSCVTTKGGEAPGCSESDVVKALRSLGCRRSEARRAAELADRMPEASLEDRVKRALTYFLPPGVPVRAAPA
jgi:hypothetical protein